jgi:hypothetical protein
MICHDFACSTEFYTIRGVSFRPADQTLHPTGQGVSYQRALNICALKEFENP